MRKFRVLDLFSLVQDHLAGSSSGQARHGMLGIISKPYPSSCSHLIAMLRSFCAQACAQYQEHGFRRNSGTHAGHLGVANRSGSGCHLARASLSLARNKRTSHLGSSYRTLTDFRARFGSNIHPNSAICWPAFVAPRYQNPSRIGGSVYGSIRAFLWSEPIALSWRNQGCTILPSRGLGQKLIHRNRSICEVFPWRK